MAGAAAAGLLVAGIPVTALGLAGTFSASPGTPGANAPMSTPTWTSVSRSAASSASGSSAAALSSSPASSPAASDPADYHGYVALAGGNLVAEVDVATDAIIAEITGADTGEGVAVAPDGSTVYVAETGQYYVLAVNAATKAQTKIEVGAYPQDVAVVALKVGRGELPVAMSPSVRLLRSRRRRGSRRAGPGPGQASALQCAAGLPGFIRLFSLSFRAQPVPYPVPHGPGAS